MKVLDGRELAGFVKERQAAEVRSLLGQKIQPKLLIIRDSDNPVITKYVGLKIRYGEDIGVIVEDKKVSSADEAKSAILEANNNPEISGIIVQLPLEDDKDLDSVLSAIAPEKDVDGLSSSLLDLEFAKDLKDSELTKEGQNKTQTKRIFDSATATAINWLLSGYDINLVDKKIGIIGRGRLVGAPLYRMWKNSGFDVTVFGHDADLSVLRGFDVIVSGTGVPHLIRSEMIKPGAILVDAGTASEGGKLVGDFDDSIYERNDLKAITPTKGGVGPLTVSVLFDDVIRAAKN